MTFVNMGAISSKPTAFDCIIKNFKKGFVGDYGVRMTPKKLHSFCELDWPSSDIGWPPEAAHCPRSTPGGRWTPGHLGQFPYTASWLLIAQTLPHGQAFTWTNRARVGYLWHKHSDKRKKEKKPIFQGDPVEDPLPYSPLTPQPQHSQRQGHCRAGHLPPGPPPSSWARLQPWARRELTSLGQKKSNQLAWPIRCHCEKLKALNKWTRMAQSSLVTPSSLTSCSALLIS